MRDALAADTRARGNPGLGMPFGYRGGGWLAGSGRLLPGDCWHDRVSGCAGTRPDSPERKREVSVTVVGVDRKTIRNLVAANLLTTFVVLLIALAVLILIVSGHAAK